MKAVQTFLAVRVFADEGGKDRRVWRPGPSSHLSKTVSSLAAGDWKRFVCVENGTMKPECAYVLRPGERHALTRVIRLASVCDNARPLYSTSVHGALFKYDWVDLCECN